MNQLRITAKYMFLAGFVFGTIGCGPKLNPEPKSEIKLYTPRLTTTAPPPTYAKTRWVRPPEVLPQRDLPGRTQQSIQRAPSLRPIFSLSLKDVPLKEAARVLAATARYSSYTASSIADENITIESIGTIDELGDKIGILAGIHVVVDHKHKEVRFLGAQPKTPQFFNQ